MVLRRPRSHRRGYESLHWRTVEDWLSAHAADPGAGEIRAEHERWRRAYVEHRRELLGWAIFVGRKL